jgi:hypothetical protein
VRRQLKAPAAERGANIKTPEQGELPPQQRKPKFSLEFLSKAYCLSSCEQQEKAAFADAIFTLTQLTWAQIGQAPRHGLGFEKIARSAITGSSAAIPSVVTDDVNIIAFRFFGKAPMVGFRREDTFYVVWLDRAFSLYDHG